MKIRLIVVGLLLLPRGEAAAGPPPAPPPVNRAEMAARVRTEFLHAWRAYEQYAWGHDELRPVTKAPHDWHAESLLMTPVDALDTLLLRTSRSRTSRSPSACSAGCSPAIR